MNPLLLTGAGLLAGSLLLYAYDTLESRALYQAEYLGWEYVGTDDDDGTGDGTGEDKWSNTLEDIQKTAEVAGTIVGVVLMILALA